MKKLSDPLRGRAPLVLQLSFSVLQRMFWSSGLNLIKDLEPEQNHLLLLVPKLREGSLFSHFWVLLQLADGRAGTRGTSR